MNQICAKTHKPAFCKIGNLPQPDRPTMVLSSHYAAASHAKYKNKRKHNFRTLAPQTLLYTLGKNAESIPPIQAKLWTKSLPDRPQITSVDTEPNPTINTHHSCNKPKLSIDTTNTEIPKYPSAKLNPNATQWSPSNLDPFGNIKQCISPTNSIIEAQRKANNENTVHLLNPNC